MSREIKFRAWDKRELEMIEDVANYFKRYEVLDEPDRYIPLQFTGLKDKNGREIYERDIVLIPDTYTDIIVDGQGPEEPHNHIAEVRYGNAEFVFIITDNADILRKGTYTWNALCEETGVDDLEVIGNVYENPELISKDV